MLQWCSVIVWSPSVLSTWCYSLYIYMKIVCTILICSIILEQRVVKYWGCIVCDGTLQAVQKWEIQVCNSVLFFYLPLIFQFQLFLLSLLTKKCSKRLFYLFCVPYCSSLKLLIFLLTVDSNGRCLEGFFFTIFLKFTSEQHFTNCGCLTSLFLFVSVYFYIQTRSACI